MVAVDQQQWTGPDGILGKLRNILVYSIYLRFSGKSSWRSGRLPNFYGRNVATPIYYPVSYPKALQKTP